MSSTTHIHSKKRPKNNLDLDFGVFGFENHSRSPKPPLWLLSGLCVVALILGLGCVCSGWLCDFLLCSPLLLFSALSLMSVCRGLWFAGSGSGRGPRVSRQRLMAEGLQASFLPIVFIVDAWMLSVLFLSSAKWREFSLASSPYF